MDELLDGLFDLDADDIEMLLAGLETFFDNEAEGVEPGFRVGGLPRGAAMGVASIPLQLATGQDIGHSVLSGVLGGTGAYVGGNLGNIAAGFTKNKLAKQLLSGAGEMGGLLVGNLLGRSKEKENELLGKALAYSQDYYA